MEALRDHFFFERQYKFLLPDYIWCSLSLMLLFKFLGLDRGCNFLDIDSVMNEVLNLNNQPRPEYVDLKAQRKDKELSERIERLKEQAAVCSKLMICFFLE